jgi:uncharacterized protein (TIGR02145 family)
MVLLFTTCEDRPHINPFDPETGPDAWAPSNLQPELINDSQIKLTWTQEYDQISGFRLERKENSESFTQIAELETNVTEYTDTDLTLGTDYIYRVKAFTEENESEYSNSVLVNFWKDCNGAWGGTAVEDCNGECNGPAYENACDYCVGGNTGINETYCDPVTDIDGNEYEIISIGNQVWMAENLKTTKYKDGTEIPTGYSDSDWSNLSTGAYAVYDNNSSNAGIYGNLYNWYTVDDERGVCPEGFHVPSDEEWKELEIYLGMSESQANSTGDRGTYEGGKLKEAGTVHWFSPNTGATNESGFTALPGGYRHGLSGSFNNLQYNSGFWTSSLSSGGAWDRFQSHDNSSILRNIYSLPTGFSVRCVRD